MSRRNAATLRMSHNSNTGISNAAACGTGMASAISGTASEPRPAPKPLLDSPSNSTAGMAVA